MPRIRWEHLLNALQTRALRGTSITTRTEQGARVTLLLIIGVMASLAMAQAVPDASFRSTEGYGEARWGMTRAEVKALYPTAVEAKTGSHLVLLGQTVAGKGASQVFHLSDDRLTSAGTVFTEKYINNNYLQEYRRLQGLLRQKYGDSKADRIIWKDSLYRNQRDQWGMAVSAGHLVLVTVWETPQTIMSIAL